MHKVILSLLLLLVFAASYLVVDEAVNRKSKGGSSEVGESDSVFDAFKGPVFFEPQTLIYKPFAEEKVLSIEQVGLDINGQYQNPSTWETAGWYVGSAKPGEKGNVIINAHYDTNTGSPAAFWGLKSLKVNDTVILQDELRRNFSYVVVDTFYIDIKDSQRTQVFEETSEKELTLVTCGGVWNVEEGTYDKRLVVKARLVSTDEFAYLSNEN